MLLIKGEGALEYVINNYNDLLELVNNGDNDLYSDLEFKTIERLLFEKIIEKINNLEKLSLNEAYLFVSRLVREVASILDIRIPCNFSIVEPDDDRLPSDSYGVFKNNCHGEFEIFYSKELLNSLCGLQEIDYEEGSELYNQTLIVSVIFSLFTFPHELTHVKQFEERYTGEINLRNFLLTLEHILCKGKYYVENAPFVYEECYADIRAIDLLFDFLRKHNILNKIDLFDITYNLMKKQYDQSMLSMKDYVVLENDNVTGIVTDDYLLFGSIKFVSENLNFLNRFLLLRLVFNENGDLLTIDSLFKKRVSIKETIEKTFITDTDYMDELFVEIDNIYSFILRSYCFIYGRENVCNEIKLYRDNILDYDKFVDDMLNMCNELECIEINRLDSSVKKRVLEMRKL